jgi:glycosyltransferase involved in cell wall biosynthesis
LRFILLLFIISILISVVFQFKYSKRISNYKKTSSKPNQDKLPVSIIICAKNEEVNLSLNLEFILNQYYPTFEVVVVDDCSTDLTLEVIKIFQNNYPNLRLVQSQEKDSKSKRKALKLGVLKAKYDRISLTDADCKPVSKFWIQEMNSCLTKKFNCVLGYSPYEYNPTFLNKIIQWETLQTGILYMYRAIEGKAYMSVGRNVMYEKSIFLESEDFENEIDLTSGDDDLLIQNIKDKSKINLCLNPERFVLSQPKTTWKSWWKQKQRHYSTSPSYDKSSQLFLGGYYFYQFLFWSTFFILCLSKERLLALFIFGIVIVAKSLITVQFEKLFKVPRAVLLIWPNLGASLLILQIGTEISGIFQKQKSWQ